MNYTARHFINKFEPTQESEWITECYHSADRTRHCALGFCDAIGTGFNERGALDDLFEFYLNLSVAEVNDFESHEYPQPTPRQRILAALYDIEKKQTV